MYLIKDRKPYFTDGKKIYKCEITKDYAKVDFGETVRAFPFDCVYALEEIKSSYSAMLILLHHLISLPKKQEPVKRGK